MMFSICIPNYNYERYIERTIQSALKQSHGDLEILVSDNASTDRSVEVINSIKDPRVRLSVNACNVGFAGNLDRAAQMATGDVMIMLSSDDMIRPEALSAYQSLSNALDSESERVVMCAAADVIDPDDKVIGRRGPDRQLWFESDRVPDKEAMLDAPVYCVKAGELLRRCLEKMKNPFNFAATAYPRKLYERVEGYGGNRLYNPDKWFHWRLLNVAESAYYIDRSLFAYRWHPSNQAAQQNSTGALKYLVDEYTSTLEVDGVLLERSGLTREALVRAFIEHDIARHGLATLAHGEGERARRILNFGRAVYPQYLKRNKKAWALAVLLSLRPLGRAIAKLAYDSQQATARNGTIE